MKASHICGAYQESPQGGMNIQCSSADGSLTKGTHRALLWCESYEDDQEDDIFSAFIRPFSLCEFSGVKQV